MFTLLHLLSRMVDAMKPNNQCLVSASVRSVTLAKNMRRVPDHTSGMAAVPPTIELNSGRLENCRWWWDAISTILPESYLLL